MLDKSSIAKLNTAHTNLQLLAVNIDKVMPILVDWAHRNEAEQNACVSSGASKLLYPLSAHNATKDGKPCSNAIDCIPKSVINGKIIDWKNVKEFEKMRALFYEEALKLGIKIKPLIVFKNGGKDMPHIELG